MKRLFLILTLCLMLPNGAAAQVAGNSVFMAELTWEEISQRLQTGYGTVIVPTGGNQQMGPHMVTGAHNSIVRYSAGEIARKLGNALVAPVIPYAPAGRIDPPEGNMLFPGTFSLSEVTYSRVLEDVARSLKQQGFRVICLMGDDEGSQRAMSQVAARLGREWVTDGVRMVYLSDYFARDKLDAWSDKVSGPIFRATAPTGHIETSELMAVDASGVRASMLRRRTDNDFRATGAIGDTTRATPALGKKYISLKIESSVEQIQHAISHRK